MQISLHTNYTLMSDRREHILKNLAVVFIFFFSASGQFFFGIRLILKEKLVKVVLVLWDKHFDFVL